MIADYIHELDGNLLAAWYFLCAYIGIYFLSGLISKATFEGAVPRGVLTSWGGADPVTMKKRIHNMSSLVVRLCSHNLAIGIALLVFGFILTPILTASTSSGVP